MKYVVCFNDYSMGYGCYVHLIGIFDTMELAKEAIKKVEDRLRLDNSGEHGHHHNRFEFEINFVGVDVNEINYPVFDDWMYNSKYNLGGHME